MQKQFDLIDNILGKLQEEDILKHLLIVGSWSLYFYKYHYEATSLPPLRTEDIDFDANFLRKQKKPVDISEILRNLGFETIFHNNGCISFICNTAGERFKIEFLIPEKGKPTDEPVDIKGFGISAQPLRWLDILEKDIVTVDYKGLKVNIPNPARFAVHKLIISQRRKNRQGEHSKFEKDIIQALSVTRMLSQMGQVSEITELVNGFSRKQKNLIKQALTDPKTEERSGMLIKELERIFGCTL